MLLIITTVKQQFLTFQFHTAYIYHLHVADVHYRSVFFKTFYAAITNYSFCGMLQVEIVLTFLPHSTNGGMASGVEKGGGKKGTVLGPEPL